MEAVFEKRSQVRMVVMLVIAGIERFRHMDHPSICELKNFYRILIGQYDELRKIYKEGE